MDISFRPATVDDVPAVLDLWLAAGSVTSAGANPDGLRRLLAHDDGALIVAVAGTAVVGSIIAGFDGWRGGIYRLAVHPDHRRLGLARRLLAAADERLATLGCPRSAAIVLTGRPDAMGFWQASTYEHQPEVSRFTRRPS